MSSRVHDDRSADTEVVSHPWWAVALDISGRERGRARLGLLLVGVAIVVLHGVAVGLDRPINWDEAIHVSQVNPAIPAVFMEPHRTRGLSLLVAPIAVFDPSMVVLRGFVVLLVAAGTVAAFSVWARTIGVAAPLAAALGASFWVTVFYSAEVLPNQPSALLAIAAVGLVVAAIAGRDRPADLPALAASMALFALVRPPDAVLVGVGIALLALLARRRPAWRATAAAAVGGAIGMVPWLVEGWVRFGFGPLATVRSAGQYSVDAHEVTLLPLYLSTIETRLRCAGACIEDHIAAGAPLSLPPVRSSLVLLVALLLTVVAVITARRQAWLAVAPLLAAVPLLVFYGSAGGAMNQRYLLPVYALLLLAPAVGIRAVWQLSGRLPSTAATLGRFTLVVALLVTAGWSTSLALERFERPATRDRAAELGQALGTVTGRQGVDCVVAARTTYPQIQYWSGCRATAGGRGGDGQLQPPLGELGSYVDLAGAVAAGADAYAVDRIELPQGSPLHTWERIDPQDDGTDGYVLYRYVPGAALPPPPCPPADDGPERTLAEVLSDDC